MTEERRDCIRDTLRFWFWVAFIIAALVVAALSWGSTVVSAITERTYTVWCGASCVTSVYERRESHPLSEWVTPPPTPNFPFGGITPATNVCTAWGTPTPHTPPKGQ